MVKILKTISSVLWSIALPIIRLANYVGCMAEEKCPGHEYVQDDPMDRCKICGKRLFKE